MVDIMTALTNHLVDLQFAAETPLTPALAGRSIVQFVRDNGWALSGYQLGPGREEDLQVFVERIMAAGTSAAGLAESVVAEFQL